VPRTTNCCGAQQLATLSCHEHQAQQLCEYYISKSISGVFFAPLEYSANRAAVNRRILEDFHKTRIPVVLLDRDVSPYHHRSQCDLVGIDNRRAGHIMTEHLFRQGCERMVFFGWPNSADTVAQRIAGYCDAARLAGKPEMVAIGDAECSDTICKLLIEHRPDGFVCANDKTAGQVMVRLNELGVEVPAKMKITGIDDAKYASFLSVPLTTIHQPCHDIGAAAVWTMIERIAHPDMPARNVFLDCQLIVRRSCGSAHS
jgi:GntR family transcriptional regulator of arabinose operon